MEPAVRSRVGGVRQSELAEFLQAAERLGFASDQFVLSAYDPTATSDRTPGRVIAIHRGAYSRDFETFPGQGWCAPAIAAMRAGHFGKP